MGDVLHYLTKRCWCRSLPSMAEDRRTILKVLSGVIGTGAAAVVAGFVYLQYDGDPAGPAAGSCGHYYETSKQAAFSFAGAAVFGIVATSLFVW